VGHSFRIEDQGAAALEDCDKQSKRKTRFPLSWIAIPTPEGMEPTGERQGRRAGAEMAFAKAAGGKQIEVWASLAFQKLMA
jgi:hypothetical protein